jgi:hypothetical protein
VLPCLFFLQPATFHNLNHGLVFHIGAFLLAMASFTSTLVLGLYYFNTKLGIPNFI